MHYIKSTFKVNFIFRTWTNLAFEISVSHRKYQQQTNDLWIAIYVAIWTFKNSKGISKCNRQKIKINLQGKKTISLTVLSRSECLPHPTPIHILISIHPVWRYLEVGHLGGMKLSLNGICAGKRDSRESLVPSALWG